MNKELELNISFHGPSGSGKTIMLEHIRKHFVSLGCVVRGCVAHGSREEMKVKFTVDKLRGTHAGKSKNCDALKSLSIEARLDALEEAANTTVEAVENVIERILRLQADLMATPGAISPNGDLSPELVKAASILTIPIKVLRGAGWALASDGEFSLKSDNYVPRETLVDEKQLELLRKIRLYHWNEALIEQTVAFSFSRRSNLDEAKAGQARVLSAAHFRHVQALNEFFPIGDTAERDAAK